MESLTEIMNARKHTRKLVTLEWNGRYNYGDLEEVQRMVLAERLERFKARLDELHISFINKRVIATAAVTEDDIEWERYEEYTNKILECLALLRGIGHRIQPPQASANVEAVRSVLRPPVAPLPRFGSFEGEDLTRFLNNFEATTNRYSYSSYDKLLLLKQQLSGRALILVNSLETDQQGYQQAKDLLEAAFASSDVQIFNTVKQLTNLKLSTSQDPYEYISKMRLLKESVNKLKIDADTFLRYYFWTGLNETFQTQLVQITNRTRPSLEAIEENFFTACERYLPKARNFPDSRRTSERSSYNSGLQKRVSSFAVNIAQTSKDLEYPMCVLCQSRNEHTAHHPIFKCPKFVSASDKVQMLRRLQLCDQCTRPHHGDCNFPFQSPCSHCKGRHYSWLCPSGSKGNESYSEFHRPSAPLGTGEETRPRSGNNISQRTPVVNAQGPRVPAPQAPFRNQKSFTEKPKLSSKLIKPKAKEQKNSFSGVLQVRGGNLGGDTYSILPTFTGYLEDGSHLRILKDSGCQVNLIEREVADRLKLTVVEENIELGVRGINSYKVYQTKTIEIKVLIGSERSTLRAVCIPRIDVELTLPGLGKVVDRYQQKGYSLADIDLHPSTDRLDNVQIILGVNDSSYIPETEHTFGLKNRSIFSTTPAGIIIKGGILQLQQDLPHLPCLLPLPSEEAGSTMQVQESPKGAIESSVQEACIFSAVPIADPNEGIEIYDRGGNINETELDKATQQALDVQCAKYIHYEPHTYSDESNEVNDRLVEYALDNLRVDEDGRLMLPLLWRSEVSNRLSQNLRLAEKILNSNLNKFRSSPQKLKLISEVFRDQESLGIIERVESSAEYLALNPNFSFLAHMPVFRLDRETTKCRVVFLSNLAERGGRINTLSHNQAMYSGPCLNQALSTALIHLRFNNKLCCFDLEKAFNNIALREVDQRRLLFLWYRDVDKGDFTPQIYKNKRLTFGLRCSPTILMMALYHILIRDVYNESYNLKSLKKLIYQLTYMDNCAISASSSSELTKQFHLLKPIFLKYHINIQQFITNDQELQETIDRDIEDPTPTAVKLLGLMWDRETDQLYTRPIQLEEDANTKRKILSTIAAQFDLYNYNCPILNRGRLFLHSLQCAKSLGWDQTLTEAQIKTWKNIVRQANSSPVIKVQRFVGDRDHRYRLVGFADSSKTMYGTVVYILNLNTNQLSFLGAKNHILNSHLQLKSIPSLELQSVVLATTYLTQLAEELSGACCVCPISIEELQVYSDSMVALSWIRSYFFTLEKMQKKSIFVLNRLKKLNEVCEPRPVTFKFVPGEINPADCVTRCMSYLTLSKTVYLKGPEFVCLGNKKEWDEPFCVRVPTSCPTNTISYITATEKPEDYSIQRPLLEKYSDLNKVINIIKFVHLFVDKLKLRRQTNRSSNQGRGLANPWNLRSRAIKTLVYLEQRIHFGYIFQYYERRNEPGQFMPNMVKQLNVCPDNQGILRVYAKLKNRSSSVLAPMLLAKDSKLTTLIIQYYHTTYAHSGCYFLLNLIRKEFWIHQIYSRVKSVLRDCTHCKRFNARTIKLNQGAYRDIRIEPPEVPFRAIYLDFLGPYFVKVHGERQKTWILCLTCMWSRAINLKVCTNMTVQDFLRALQLHAFEFGVPTMVISDLGSQIVAGSRKIEDYLKDPDTFLYFQKHGVVPTRFEQYPKGCSSLGSMVEICVKLTKRLISGSIKNTVLTLPDFEFIMCQTVHMLNKRPLVFREALRNQDSDQVPFIITPEMLLYGRELLSINLVPELHRESGEDWVPPSCVNTYIRKHYEQLLKVKNNLIDKYHSEFLYHLMNQATDRKDRYEKRTSHPLNKGDLVLIKEPLLKPYQYPMGMVTKVVRNNLGEVTAVGIRKGGTGEIVQRHASVIIPLLAAGAEPPNPNEVPVAQGVPLHNRPPEPPDHLRRNPKREPPDHLRRNPTRKAAQDAVRRIRQLSPY